MTVHPFLVRSTRLAVAVATAAAAVVALAPGADAATGSPSDAPAGPVTVALTAMSGCTWEPLTGSERLQLWAGTDTSVAPIGAFAVSGVDATTVTVDLGSLGVGRYSYGFTKSGRLREAGPLPCGTDDLYVEGGNAPGILDVVELPDTDGDGLNDRDEEIHRTDMHNPDSDGDGLSDGDEVKKYSTDPTDADTDDGGQSDGDEVAHGTDPVKDATDDDSDGDGLPNDFETCAASEVVGIGCTGTSPTSADTDGDGLADGRESCARPSKKKDEEAAEEAEEAAEEEQQKKVAALGAECIGSDPLDPDTDNGGVSDGDEVQRGTNPLSAADDAAVAPADSDGDGLSDTDETTKYHTDPKNADTDGDGLRDGDEVTIHRTDPTNPDTDSGGVKDGDEVKRGTNPLRGADDDTDGDGLSDKRELELGTDRTKPDTDGDGVIDGREVNEVGSSPLRADTDGDGIDDGVELVRGTNPLVAGSSATRPAAGSSGSPGSNLAFTGSGGDRAAVGLVLVLAGAVLVMMRRRRVEVPVGRRLR